MAEPPRKGCAAIETNRKMMNNYRNIISAAAAAIALMGAAPAAAQTQYVMQPEGKQYSWEADLHHRLLCDFTKSREQVKDYIRRFIPDVTDAQMDSWEQRGELEARTIDGEKRYFYNAGPNLFRINKE